MNEVADINPKMMENWCVGDKVLDIRGRDSITYVKEGGNDRNGGFAGNLKFGDSIRK